MISNEEIILRLILSAIAGSIVGMEREVNHSYAGLRTHILVTLGSALIMMISMYGFRGLGVNHSGGEPARLAAQVVSGIGFLGAGTILRTENNIRGLTTAASIWVCGGIGLAIGNGYYLGGAATTIIVLFVLRGLGFLQKRLSKRQYKILIVQCRERAGLIGDIGYILGKNDITINEIKINSEDGMAENGESILEIRFKVKLPHKFEDNGFFDDILSVDGVENAIWKGKIEAWG